MQEFKEKVLAEIIKYSKAYKTNLVDFEYLLLSKNFEENKFYIIACEKDNFLHLTGVRTSLKAGEFFDKAYNNTLSIDDFHFGMNENRQKYIKGVVRQKVRFLGEMTRIFTYKNLHFQENFRKNKIRCDLATSDLKCTLGFIGKKKARPMTLLAGNKLSSAKKIDLILKRKKGMKKFSKIVYGNNDLLVEFKDSLSDYNII